MLAVYVVPRQRVLGRADNKRGAESCVPGQSAFSAAAGMLCHVINPAPGQTCLLFSLAARANRGIPSLCPPPFSTHTTSCIAAATTEVRSRRLGRNPRIDSTKQRASETAVVSAKNGARFEDSATGGHAACKGRKGKTDAFDETL